MKLKLKIKTVTYSRLKVTEEYENERLEMTAEVAPESDGVAETRLLKAHVCESLGIETPVRRQRGHGPVCICDDCM